ncbi:unnamed protein product [Orchesella dallaii]|uniref:Uncharacterized protein n=1 Tax=Orchesella dallaii TaxID=48710 RepID=A0ABP1Q0W2_9HEXA
MPPPEAKLYPGFSRQCPNGGQDCEFNSADSPGTSLYFKCRENNICFCSRGVAPADVPVWPVQWSDNNDCQVTKGGPCGDENGLTVNCMANLSCIQGRCRNPNELHSGTFHQSCNDELDCQSGLKCRQPTENLEINIKRCMNSCRCITSTWDETVWLPEPDPETFAVVSEGWYYRQLQTTPPKTQIALTGAAYAINYQHPTVTWLCICDECVFSAAGFAAAINARSEAYGAIFPGWDIIYNMWLTTGTNPLLHVVAVLNQTGDEAYGYANGTLTDSNDGWISPAEPDLADTDMFPPLPSVGNSDLIAIASSSDETGRQLSLPSSDVKKEGENDLVTYANALHNGEKKKVNKEVVKIEQAKTVGSNESILKKVSFGDLPIMIKKNKKKNAAKNEGASAANADKAAILKSISDEAAKQDEVATKVEEAKQAEVGKHAEVVTQVEEAKLAEVAATKVEVATHAEVAAQAQVVTQTEFKEDDNVMKTKGALAVNTNVTATKKVSLADMPAKSKGKGIIKATKNEGEGASVAKTNGAATKKVSFANVATNSTGKGNVQAFKNEGGEASVVKTNGTVGKKMSFAAAAQQANDTGRNDGAPTTTSPKKTTFADIAAKRNINGKK